MEGRISMDQKKQMKFVDLSDVKSNLNMNETLKIVEEVYTAKSCGVTETFDTIFYEFDNKRADMDIKSGYLKYKKIFGHKTVTWFEDNATVNLPTLFGNIALFNAETGIPLGLVEASYITGMRTGAAAAIGAKYLANPDAKSVLIVGTGNQAIYQIAAILTIFPHIEEINFHSRNHSTLINFVNKLPSTLNDNFKINVEGKRLRAIKNLEQGVKISEIIITITPTKEPFILKEWVQPGTHISCMGADMKGKQEIDPLLLADARVYVDDMFQCLSYGECEKAINDSIISKHDIIGEIGDLVSGEIQGRTSSKDITIFDSTGLAILDLAVAYEVFKTVESRRIINYESVL